MISMEGFHPNKFNIPKIASDEPGLMPWCPVCHCMDTEKAASHSGFDSASVFYCMNCSHHFTHPEPDSRWLDLYYAKTYRKFHIGPSHCELMKRRADAQIRFIKRCLGNSNRGFSEWKICDIGCGIGALVAQFAREGAMAEGYDPDLGAIRFGKRHWKANIQVGSVETARHDVQNLNLICLSHVLEHLPDIRSSFLKALSGLRKGGYIFVEVPRYKKEVFDHPMDMESHLHFFTPSSLTTLLEKLGLSPITCATCGPPVQGSFRNKEKKGSCIERNFHSLWNRFLVLVNRSGSIKTVYDGFYGTYYPTLEDGGIWIRCLARKEGEDHGNLSADPC